MFDKFTERARKVIILAREEAGRLNHDYIGTEHILLGLIREGQGVGAVILQNLGADIENIIFMIEELVKSGGGMLTLGEIPFSSRAKKVLELAIEEARAFNHTYVGTEHILLGLIKEEESIAAQVLGKLGISYQKVREETIKLLNGGAVPGVKQKAKSKTPVIDEFCRDLTIMSREKKLDPVIGRNNEIDRVIQILSRRTKNNPILIGEAGVGKTAIVEGLAQRIVEKNVPDILLNKRVLTLDLPGIVAGTKYRGQFEERMKAIINEIRSAKNIIVFIDEIHSLIGAGGAEGAIDASNMLKPPLSRGELQCIGATTLDEYRKYIEKDGALERRFQSVLIEPTNVEETIEILKGLREKYETHHHVKISIEAIIAAAKMSDKYVSDRFLPDKAIDLIDEASARVKLKKINVLPDTKDIEEEIKIVRKEKDNSIKAQEFEKAAMLRDKEWRLKQSVEDKKKEWDESQKQNEPEITQEDIAFIVSRWTGIPVTELKEEETVRLLRMEDELKKKIVGQDEAIHIISQAIRRARAGLRDPERPIGSFIFLGPSGVGKTELAKVLADFLFGNEDALIQIDMSEYMEKFSVSRLIGAPPGYVGYDEGGQLTERVRRKPYSVVLLDEIEKAHPDVFNILLQVLEDGHLTDNLGHTVDFRNTVMIMTSNVGAREIENKMQKVGFTKDNKIKNYSDMKDKLIQELKKTFRPEFLNRVDEVIVFHSLGKKELEKIIDLLLSDVLKRLEEKKIKLVLSAESKDFLIKKGYDENLGARPLRRVIQQYIEDLLAGELLSGRIKEGDIVSLMQKDESIVFEKAKL
ncbi:MAG: ATP-dependent Clp protease ATP-binding subunit [bacterium]|nr:ATP-dependent Clp protease ATP-binding subunit [bacterium]